MVDYGPFFLHEPVSCTHPVVSEQQQQLAKKTSHFFSLSAWCSCMCRGVCAVFAQLAQLDAHDVALLRRVMQAQCRPGTGMPSTGESRVDRASGGEAGL